MNEINKEFSIILLDLIKAIDNLANKIKPEKKPIISKPKPIIKKPIMKKAFIPFDRQCKYCNANFTIKSHYQNIQLYCNPEHKNKYLYNEKKIKKAKVELLAIETKNPIVDPSIAKIAIDQNDKIQQKPIVNVEPFTIFKASKKAINYIDINTTKKPTYKINDTKKSNDDILNEILQNYFNNKSIVYDDNTELSDIDILELTVKCEQVFKIQIDYNILNNKNSREFINVVLTIIENNKNN